MVDVLTRCGVSWRISLQPGIEATPPVAEIICVHRRLKPNNLGQEGSYTCPALGSQRISGVPSCCAPQRDHTKNASLNRFR